MNGLRLCANPSCKVSFDTDLELLKKSLHRLPVSCRSCPYSVCYRCFRDFYDEWKLQGEDGNRRFLSTSIRCKNCHSVDGFDALKPNFNLFACQLIEQARQMVAARLNNPRFVVEQNTKQRKPVGVTPPKRSFAAAATRPQEGELEDDDSAELTDMPSEEPHPQENRKPAGRETTKKGAKGEQNRTAQSPAPNSVASHTDRVPANLTGELNQEDTRTPAAKRRPESDSAKSASNQPPTKRRKRKEKKQSRGAQTHKSAVVDLTEDNEEETAEAEISPAGVTSVQNRREVDSEPAAVVSQTTGDGTSQDQETDSQSSAASQSQSIEDGQSQSTEDGFRVSEQSQEADSTPAAVSQSQGTADGLTADDKEDREDDAEEDFEFCEDDEDDNKYQKEAYDDEVEYSDHDDDDEVYYYHNQNQTNRKKGQQKNQKAKQSDDEQKEVKKTARITLQEIPLSQRGRLRDKVDWMPEFKAFLADVLEDSESNIKRVEEKVRLLKKGDGIRDRNWPTSVYFYRNINVNLSANFYKMLHDAVEMENEHGKDKGHGWLLRHPIKKLGAFQAHLLGKDLFNRTCKITIKNV